MKYTLFEDSNNIINDYYQDTLRNTHPDISYSRLLVSYWFHKKIRYLNNQHFNNISIISGSINEPELKSITYDNLNNCSFDDDIYNNILFF